MYQNYESLTDNANFYLNNIVPIFFFFRVTRFIFRSVKEIETALQL